MAQGLLSRSPGYVYGIDAILPALLSGRQRSPSQALRATLLDPLIPVRSPFLDVDETSDDARLELTPPGAVVSAYQGLMAPLDVMRGRVSPREGANRATALIGGGGLLGTRPSGSLGMGGRVRNIKVPYSNYTLPQSRIDQLKAETAVRSTPGYVKEKTISPESLDPKGSLLNLVGDRSNVGEITKLGGLLLNRPITLDGGRGFMRGKRQVEGSDYGSAWASDPEVIKRLSGAVRRAEGQPVYGTYVAMGGRATDFADMTRQVAMRNFEPSMLKKKDIKDFDKSFRAAKAYKKKNEETGEYTGPADDFPGIASPKLDDWLDKSGTRRAAFFHFMDKTKWRDAGFPNVTEARFAIQDPKLRDLPAGVEVYGGQSIARMEPQGLMVPGKDLPMPHGTYKMNLQGNYMGGLERGIPRSVLFPEFYQARRAAGVAPSGDNRAFAMSQVLQPTNQQWLDGVMKYLEEARSRPPR